MNTGHRPPSPWDVRYDADNFRYGTEPNDFLRAEVGRLPADSRVLCLAEGEGRNAVFLAGAGHRPLGVDTSEVGLQKAEGLARERGVSIETLVADLATLQIRADHWDAVVSIWCHLPGPARRDLHRRVVAGLRPGGVLILEAYTPAQLQRGTGGPPDPDRFMTLAGLRHELEGLEFLVGREVVRDVHEGDLHHGSSDVVQVVARHP